MEGDGSVYEALFDLVERRARDGIDGATAADLVAKFRTVLGERNRLRALIKVLCSDPSPFGSEAFQRARDIVDAEHKALLFEVLNG